MPGREFPAGKRFAFTIIDDTDVATVENAEPFYRMLDSLGMRTTKTVWPVGCPEGSKNFSSSQTLEDSDYLAFVLDLQKKGFEITWHGATMESSRRERTRAALQRFRELLGTFPRIHANHAENRENLYWGRERIDDRVLKFAFAKLTGAASAIYEGHVEGSPYWWGDLCAKHIAYVRNLTFSSLNLAGINPTMPYFDPRRPLVRGWFSASDADSVTDFNALLHPAAQERLERESGFSILATHVGKGFVQNGCVHPVTRRHLEALARRPGWYVPVGELLDWLAERRQSETLPGDEWRRMQWRWARDVTLRKWGHRKPWFERLEPA
ncbi:MAG: hypothetical protein ACRD2Y_01880 [Terriglobales bacterium]